MKILNYGLWAFGLSGGLVAAGVLVMQHVVHVSVGPTLLLALLALPALCFYALSEYARATQEAPSLHPITAFVLLAGLLLAYALPMLLTLLALPAFRPGFAHYSIHAPFALAAGLLLIRLHALKAWRATVFFGVTAVLAALFFLAIRIPGWLLGDIPPQSAGTTFEFFALALIGVSYPLLLASIPGGPLPAAFAAFADVSDGLWQSVKAYMAALLLLGCHAFALLSLLWYSDQRLLPLVFALLAGLWAIAGQQFRRPACFWLAFAGVLATMFFGSATYAWWPRAWNLWLLLALLVALAVGYHLRLKHASRIARRTLWAWFGIVTLLMAYEYATTYRLSSRLGVLPFLVVWGLGFLLPASSALRDRPGFQSLLGAWLFLPAAAVFFMQGYPSLTHVPNTLLAVLLICGFVMAYRGYAWHWFPEDGASSRAPLAWHHLHGLLTQPSSLMWVFALLTAAALSVHVVSLLAGAGLFTRYLVSMTLVQGTLAVYWFDVARAQKRWWATVAAELMAGGLLFTLRRGIPAMFNVRWSTEWDMLIGWAVAVAIVAAKALLHAQNRAVRLPIRITLFGLPILTAMYALDYRVDFEFFALIVLPLYSLLFLFQAYSERNRFVLSYAFVGLNAYFALLFAHQQFHAIQWYVTPVSLSALILVEVFRDMTSASTANVVRGLALAAVLGTAMTQAAIGNSLSPMAHLGVIGLSALAIVAASLLRVKIFAAFGLFAFVVDLAAIVYLAVSRQGIEALLVTLGGGLTLIGFLTLGGYYVYRGHKRALDAFATRLHHRFRAWE